MNALQGHGGESSLSRTGSGSAFAKVPEVTAGFWLIKILATTLGETAGDLASMSMGLGYLVSTCLFAVAFAVTAAIQIRATRFQPWLYWGTIIASTTVGTTLADFADRSLGIGYPGGAALLLLLLIACLFAWHRTLGSISIGSVADRRTETFYWATIACSQTLGTALGDWAADSAGLGYAGGIVLFGGLLGVVLAMHFTRKVSPTLLFWAAFVLTRPLGAVVGDFLDKPVASGGLDLSRGVASLVLLALIVVLIRVLPQKPAARAH